jgi:hypothetical protein
MIDFEEELKNYQPLPELDELKDDVNPGELQDVLRLIQSISAPPKKPSGQRG